MSATKLIGYATFSTFVPESFLRFRGDASTFTEGKITVMFWMRLDEDASGNSALLMVTVKVLLGSSFFTVFRTMYRRNLRIPMMKQSSG